MKKLAVVILGSWLVAVVAAARPLLLTIEHYPTPAVISNLTCDAPSSTEIHCTADTNKPTTLNFQYQIAPIGWLTTAAATSADGKSHDLTWGSLAGGLNFYVRVKATDAEGTQSFSSYINVQTPNVTAIPVLSSFAITAVGTTSFSATWVTDINGDSQLECSTNGPGAGDGYEVASTLDATAETAHAHTFTGLTSGATVYCRGRSEAAGGIGYSEEVLVQLATAGTLTPPLLGDLDIRNVEADRVCLDPDGDGVCNGYRFMAKMPMDTSSWHITDLGTNPPASYVSSQVSTGSGCRIFEFDGTINIADSVEMTLTRDCFLLRGKNQALQRILIADGATANNISACDSLPGSVAACGGSEGASVSWTGGYNRDATTLTLASSAAAAGFNVYNPAAPYGSGMYVVVNSDFSVATCPDRFQRQGNAPQPGTKAIHRVVGVSGNQITIWPGLYYDYDEFEPNCVGYTARPATITVAAFEYVNIEMEDGDDGCVGTLGSLAGCNSTQAGLLLEKVQGWVRYSRIFGQVNRHLHLHDVVDFTVLSNEIANPPQPFTEPIFITSQIAIDEGSSGWAVLDNYGHDMRTFVHARVSAQGVVAHNYTVNMRQSSVMIHGLYAGPILNHTRKRPRATIQPDWPSRL